ncbi:MAG TPA: glycosyltransferase, partial [bacterium]
VEQGEIRRLLEGAHILLAPSVTAQDGDQEGIPNVVKEAMATGMPVVSTRHSGIPELVQDAVSGFLVAERDVDALAERLVFLIDHPETWPEMGRAGRRKVEADFDVEHMHDRLIALYAQVLDRGAHIAASGRGVAVAP